MTNKENDAFCNAYADLNKAIDVAPRGDGLSELRMFFGSGYRVYFGKDTENIVVVLCGGDKST
ncbi:hypothetical protein LC609_04535 [Nostoc sp. XA013]|nr:hypothetical protein [Nostoc sp. XA013]